MKTTTYKTVRNGILRRMGIDAAQPIISSQAAALADYVTNALDTAWSFFPWPNITVVEQRTPTGSPAKFISYDQPAATPIGDFLQILDVDPSDYTTLPVSYSFTTTSTGATITDSEYTAATPVFVRFRTPAPQFTATSYDPATTYAPGELVYYDTTGDCYLSILATTGNAPTSTTHWRRQEIPYFLSDYAQTAAHAETLLEDGQYDKGSAQLTRAQGILETKQDEFWMKRDIHHHYTAKFTH